LILRWSFGLCCSLCFAAAADGAGLAEDLVCFLRRVLAVGDAVRAVFVPRVAAIALRALLFLPPCSKSRMSNVLV